MLLLFSECFIIQFEIFLFCSVLIIIRLVIKELLNRQTINQFTIYAQQQYPDSEELQQQLIKQLQEQHYQQYIEQMMMEQL